MRKSFTRWLTAAAASVAMVAALGPAEAQDKTGITDDTIKIATFGPLTGPNSTYGAILYGIMAYWKDVNDRGGIHGRKIDIIAGDTACNEAKGVAVAKKLLHQDKVFLIHGGVCSGVALAMKPLIVEAKVPWVLGGTTHQDIASPAVPTIFRGIPDNHSLARDMVKFALTKPGAKKLAVVRHTNEWAKGIFDPVERYVKSNPDKAELVLDLSMERGDPNATPHVLKIRESDVDMVVMILYEPEAAVFLKDRRKYGLDVPVMSSTGAGFDAMLNRVGNDVLKDTMFVNFFKYSNLTAPQTKKWRDQIHKYYPNEKLIDLHFNPQASAMVIEQALRKVGRDLTREKFVAEMDKVRDFDSDLLAGKITFTPDDHSGVKGSAAMGLDETGEPRIFLTWPER